VSITGTNGKSTVTALVAHLMRYAGRNAPAAGNIGTAISAVALEPNRPDWLALELSSFQLHDLPDVRPAVGVLTNLSADHLDRYRDIEEYLADKRQMFVNATAASIWVSNLDDQLSREMVQGVDGRHLSFSLQHRADGWIDRDSGWLMLGSQRMLPRDELHLLGDHNVANALAAALAVHATGVSVEQLARGLTSFRALEHRMEPVATVNDVLYINDSKATNVASTRVALEAMDRPYVLLLGGFHKGEPYTSLREVLGGAVAVVAYGAAADLVVNDLEGAARLERAGAFEEAVRKAASLAPSGGAVLLSPACSSYDQFNNYEERGRTFRDIVATL
jgi:UDP-N-acetylmuramoylalanine--D-glutamate ligase